MMKDLNQFVGVYPISKTLCFELKPVESTKKNFDENGILENDRQRSVDSKVIKKIMDEYHKDFIDWALNDFVTKLNDDADKWQDLLERFNHLYHLPSSAPDRHDNMILVQNTLRQLISACFTDSELYKSKKLFGKELIDEKLPDFVRTPKFEAYLRKQKGNENFKEKEICEKQEEMIRKIKQFKGFTTYFSSYHVNRKNLYVPDDKSTSIAHRIITENLPKFIDNMDVFNRVSENEVIATHFDELYQAMKSYLNVSSIHEMFRLEYFQMVLTQKQIDVYNAIIGGINEYINQYNQQQTDKSQRLPKLKLLFKQILSDRNAISWLPDEFESDSQMLESINKYYQELKTKVFEGDSSLKVMLLRLGLSTLLVDNSLKAMLLRLGTYDLEHIYIPNDLQLTNISQKYYGNWSLITKAYEEEVRMIAKEEVITKHPQKAKESDTEYQERIKNLLKTKKCEENIKKELEAKKSFSLAHINRLLIGYLGEEYKPIELYFVCVGAKDFGDILKSNLFSRIEKAYMEVLPLLISPYPKTKVLAQDKANVDKIKDLLDAIKNLQRFVKPLLGKGTEGEKDNNFYGDFIPLWEILDQITPLYNMVRNRMTQKPYSDEKIQLYFGNNGGFLSGWPDSKTETTDNATQYGGYLFRKRNSIGEYDYYLGVSVAKKLFRNFNPVADTDRSDYERLNYYQLKSKTFYGALYKGDYKSESAHIKTAIERFIFNKGDFAIQEKVKKINTKRKEEQPKISVAIGYLNILKLDAVELYNQLLKDELFEQSNQAMMASIKNTLLALNRIPSAQESAQKSYSLFSEIMDEVDTLLQKSKIFSYFHVSETEMDKVVNRTERPLYLFKIINKDLSFAENYERGLRKSRGTDNLHTMYFKALMSGNQNVFDIGAGSVFFREQKISYSEEQLKRGHHHEMLKEKFNYPIISKKRYAYDKFQFHLSIKMNYNSDNIKDINPMVNTYLKESNDLHIIGIDRGERHLLYLSLIDLQGNIVEQYSLNEIVNEYKGSTFRTNYHDLLDAREKQRDEARRSWRTIESIKELKEGYMSQVIHKITTLMMKYNAIIVLEDLNISFMRGRQKVEKQVYQKFEKMLIDKLNYLVDKKRKMDDLGGVLKAYQLTNNEQKPNKQNGFLFYIPAWNTSKMDPTTGFVNLLDTRYVNIEKAKAFFEEFKSIRYNDAKDWFEFDFDYDDFTKKASDTKTRWTLCTYGTRIETKRDPKKKNQFVSEESDLTKKFKELFTQYTVDIDGNLKEQICSQNNASFFKELLHLLRLTLQMRNSFTGTEVDYMISPVMNAKGQFYDSRICGKNLPENADANGAYNIARKGLWIIEQMKQSKYKDTISNKEWLQYAQDRPCLNF